MIMEEVCWCVVERQKLEKRSKKKANGRWATTIPADLKRLHGFIINMNSNQSETVNYCSLYYDHGYCILFLLSG